MSTHTPATAPCSTFRQCRCRAPDPSTHAWMGRPAPLVVSHYAADCTGCYSCEWLRYAVHAHVPDPAREGEMVPNTRRQLLPGGGRGPEERRRPGAAVMYVYPKKVGGRPRWVAVPRRPFLPYLLREQDTAGVERFVRLDTGEWAGLRAQGRQDLLLGWDARPPLMNPLYPEFGYGPGVSPYLPPGHWAYGKGLAPALWSSRWVPGLEPLPPHAANAAPLPGGSWCWAAGAAGAGVGGDFREDNTTIFVGCLAGAATRGDLAGAFGRFGELADVKVFAPGRGRGAAPVKNGFVYFFARRDAQMALEQLQGVPIRGERVRLSWGEPEDPGLLRSRAACHVYPGPGQVQ